MRFRIFVVDDDRHYARLLSYRLDKNPDYEVHVFSSGEAALEKVEEIRPGLVLLDIMMPGIGGIETLRRLRERRPNQAVVMVSAQGVINTAVEAMNLGAYDYITKGQDDLMKLDVVVKNVLERAAMRQELEALRDELAQRYRPDGFVGDSPAFEGVHRLLQQALRNDLAVALQGERGTGKAHLGRVIHFHSPRRHGPFVVFDAAAGPEHLLERELFGHEDHAAAGPPGRRTGRLEEADGGTLLLKEVGALSLGLQDRLLEALRAGGAPRVGGDEPIPFDVRVVSTTTQDMLGHIRTGQFREDFYYRLFQFPVHLPPLRERGGDALRLAEHFLAAYGDAHPEVGRKALGPDARRAVAAYAWPGNVAELREVVERAALVAEGTEIMPADLVLPGGLPGTQPDGAAGSTATGAGGPAGKAGPHIPALGDVERQAVAEALRLCDGNVGRAADALGIDRAALLRLLEKHGLPH